MKYLVLEKNGTRERVQFVHYVPDHIPTAHKSRMIEVEDLAETPTTKPHQVTVLYANTETGEHWWEIENKAILSKYEFFSMLGKDNRMALRDMAESDADLEDALFMLDLQSEIQMDSEEVQAILAQFEI